MNKQEHAARQLIGTWLAKEKIKTTGKLRHVQPRAYVIGYAAPGCLVVATPWMDSEPQTQVFDSQYPLKTVRTFDNDLHAGDWCALAYFCSSSRQEHVAVAWKKP